MKHFIKSLLVLSFVFSALNSIQAQQYQSVFGNESTKWKYPFCNLDVAEVQEKISNETTTLNNVQYEKIGTPYQGTINYTLVPNSGNALAREDLQNGRVWYTSVIETIQGYDTVEFLIMDLSLQIDDSFVIHELFGDEDIAIVDSVYYLSGLKHVRTTYQHWASDFPLTFIEGIGTNYGIAYMHDHYNMCSCLLSVDKDSEEVYLNNACNPASAGIKEEPIKQLYLFPNPASKTIVISKLTGKGTYTITNILGETVRNGTYFSTDLNIDLSALKNNIYFIEIEGEIMKFIKE